MPNSNNSLKKITLVASSLILNLVTIGVTPAQASLVFWDLDFFENSGTQVGDGEFGYDPTTTTFVQTSVIFPGFPVEGFEVQTALETFSANVFEDTFELNTLPGLVAWWAESDRNPGQQLFDPREPIPTITENRWIFLPQEQWLFISGMQEISDALWAGSWSYIKFTSSTIPEPIFGSGQWTATLRPQAVPEPTTTLGLLAFSALGVASAWKSKRN
ncbi:MAG: hypothetical protein AAFO04_29970 [Cyanobacteria bacterium J06592_8]